MSQNEGAMAVKIDAIQARAHAMLNVAQREKDKRERAKKEAAGDASGEEAAGEQDTAQPGRTVGGLIDRSA